MTDNSENDLPELDVSPLDQALRQFERALAAWRESPENEFVRDAVIQRFEFTYELSIKMLRRYLRSVAAYEDEVNDLSFKELIRRGSELGLLQGDVLAWLDFRQARNDTVHTYNETRAVEVATAAGEFASQARILLTVLKERVSA